MKLAWLVWDTEYDYTRDSPYILFTNPKFLCDFWTTKYKITPIVFAEIENHVQ